MMIFACMNKAHFIFLQSEPHPKGASGTGALFCKTVNKTTLSELSERVFAGEYTFIADRPSCPRPTSNRIFFRLKRSYALCIICRADRQT